MTAEKKLIEIVASGCHCKDAPRSPLFSVIDDSGDPLDSPSGADVVDWPTVTYDAPDYVEAHVGLEYLELLVTQGSDYAWRWAMIEVLGKPGWDALRAPGVSYELLMDVSDEVLRRVRGSTSPKGK